MTTRQNLMHVIEMCVHRYVQIRSQYMKMQIIEKRENERKERKEVGRKGRR